MYVIRALNVNDALLKGVKHLMSEGIKRESRAGTIVESPMPVTTCYSKPWERVLLSEERDANPFFHLMESLWILAGREDVKFLTEFNKRMAEYSDYGQVFNAPYGYRIRGGIHPHKDQLEQLIECIKNDPDSRQLVLQIWSAGDLVKDTKDKACNMSVVFRTRPVNGENVLDITVYNRSNDALWGAYGANMVQFSMLHEYVAARTGIAMGKYYQVSNSFHVYTDGPGGELWENMKNNYWVNPYPSYRVAMRPSQMDKFDEDLKWFFDRYDKGGLSLICDSLHWESDYFKELVLPMLCVFFMHKKVGPQQALKFTHRIKCNAWGLAAEKWLNKRQENRNEKAKQDTTE